jgi:sRNA-binding protein
LVARIVFFGEAVGEYVEQLSKRHRRGQYFKSVIAEFPCFGHNRPHPLAIGIHFDLARRHPDVPRGDIESFLCRYTRHPRYKAKLICGAARIDLDGNARGAVSERDAQHAGETLVGLECFIEAAAIARSLVRRAAP